MSVKCVTLSANFGVSSANLGTIRPNLGACLRMGFPETSSGPRPTQGVLDVSGGHPASMLTNLIGSARDRQTMRLFVDLVLTERGESNPACALRPRSMTTATEGHFPMMLARGDGGCGVDIARARSAFPRCSASRSATPGGSLCKQECSTPKCLIQGGVRHPQHTLPPSTQTALRPNLDALRPNLGRARSRLRDVDQVWGVLGQIVGVLGLFRLIST